MLSVSQIRTGSIYYKCNKNKSLCDRYKITDFVCVVNLYVLLLNECSVKGWVHLYHLFGADSWFNGNRVVVVWSLETVLLKDFLIVNASIRFGLVHDT